MSFLSGESENPHPDRRLLPFLLMAIALLCATTVELRSAGRAVPAPTQAGVGKMPPPLQQKRAFTFEDMMKLKRMEEPAVSPDAKWVLFAAVDVDLKANTRTPHVWLVPLDIHVSRKPGDHSTTFRADAGHPGERMIISDQDADRPRWSPDGKRFAFVSTKKKGSQIWIADFDTATGKVTAKRRLTDMPTEADGELWSPDGKNILFKSDVYPECDGTPAEQTSCNAKKVEDAKNSKIKAQAFSHLLYRHWNAYKEGRRTHLFLQTVTDPEATHRDAVSREFDRVQGATPFPAIPLDLTPGDHDAPAFSLGGQDHYAFSPDGREICYASNHDKDEAVSTNNDLFIVPVDAGAGASSAQVLAATKNITADNEAADETPLYPPDGRYIAYRAQARPGYESDRWRLMLYERKTGEKTNLTETFDRWAGSFTWMASSTQLFFTAEERGESRIHSLAIDRGEPSAIVSGYLDDLTMTRDGRWLLFTSMSIRHPNEIHKLQVPGPGEAWLETLSNDKEISAPDREQKYVRLQSKSVTHLNDSILSQIAMRGVEPFWFGGANGGKVEGFLVKPPNFDASKTSENTP